VTIFVGLALAITTGLLAPLPWEEMWFLEFLVPPVVVLVGLVTVWPSISPQFPEGDSWKTLLIAAGCAAAGASSVTPIYVLMRVGEGLHGMGIFWAFVCAGYSLVAIPVSFLAPRIFDPALRPLGPSDNELRTIREAYRNGVRK
jgi:hypothetical protein